MKTCILIGSQSQDVSTNTQADCNAVISSLVASIPNADYIAISTYLDYATQIQRWATAIHNAGKKMFLRSAGFLDWQGTFGATQYTSADFSAHSASQYVTWINTNYSILQSGDVFEPIPDESENNSMWNSTYGTIGSGAGLTAFNTAITNGISQINTALANNGVAGVLTGYCFTNASAGRDVITDATAALLVAVGTDDYPEGSLTDPLQIRTSMLSELNTWIASNKVTVPKHIIIGPNVNVQLTQAAQKEALRQELFIIQKTISNLDGISIWQFGATDNNPKSRLFDYTGGVWVARSAASLVDSFFATLKNTNTSFKRVPFPSRSGANSRTVANARSVVSTRISS